MDGDELYGLPLERFTAERNALAKRLRQDGERSRAQEVSKLRKPSLAAWAVNQLVRTQKRDFDALMKAGDTLERAQAALLSGEGDAAALRKAAEAERAARERLLAKGRGLLSSEGHELLPAKLEHVSDTLHAAAIDEQARAQVRDGCLVRELRHAGLGAFGEFGELGGLGGASAPPPEPRRRAKDDGAAKREADERAGKLKEARHAEAAARRELERAERRLRVAEERHERVASELRKSEQALETARELVAEARGGHERAQRALEEI